MSLVAYSSVGICYVFSLPSCIASFLFVWENTELKDRGQAGQTMGRTGQKRGGNELR